MGDITLLIERARAGDGSALDDLFQQLYPELSDPEIACALDINARTVRRDWQKARVLLSVALR